MTKRNKEKKPVTDGEVEALRKGLITVLASLLELAKFKESQEGTVQVLKYLPVESHAITGLQSQVDGNGNSLRIRSELLSVYTRACLVPKKNDNAQTEFLKNISG